MRSVVQHSLPSTIPSYIINLRSICCFILILRFILIVNLLMSVFCLVTLNEADESFRLSEVCRGGNL